MAHSSSRCQEDVGVVGLGFAFWTSRLAESMLFGIEPRDPVVFAGAALTIVVVGLLAGWVPAHRASRLHPARTLTETRS
ncbi:MAG: hypothetical protein OXH75_07280 [Acidobacteria bacterium]|nr:hypothetical protein [Acidobacteriota bacterium]